MTPIKKDLCFLQLNYLKPLQDLCFRLDFHCIFILPNHCTQSLVSNKEKKGNVFRAQSL